MIYNEISNVTVYEISIKNFLETKKKFQTKIIAVTPWVRDCNIQV